MRIALTDFDTIIARAARTRQVYDALTPEQKKEVDDYNTELVRLARASDLDGLKAMPVSPMVAHMDAAGDTAMHLGKDEL